MEDEISELTDEELTTQWKKLKTGKAPGEDGIENETWKYMPGEIGDALRKLMKNVSKRGIAGRLERGDNQPDF